MCTSWSNTFYRHRFDIFFAIFVVVVRAFECDCEASDPSSKPSKCQLVRRSVPTTGYVNLENSGFKKESKTYERFRNQSNL